MSERASLSSYQLLPAVHRLRDAQTGGALEAILQVIDEQVQMVQSSTHEVLDDFFIETCRPEMVPYVGELVGNGAMAGLTTLPKQAAARRRALRLSMPRRQVANAIAHQKRKGTLPVLEELAMAVAQWHSRANEWYPRVTQFQDVRQRHALCFERDADLLDDMTGMGQFVNMRTLRAEGSLEGGFSQGAFLSDLKPIAEYPFRKNRDLIRLHLWRLQPMRVTLSRARCIWHCDKECKCDGQASTTTKTIEVYAFDSLGLSRPICNQPSTLPLDRAEQIDALEPKERLPLLLTREELQVSENGPPKPVYYGRDKSLSLWEETCSGDCCKSEGNGKACTCSRHLRLIRRRKVRVGDLSWVLCGCDQSEAAKKERIERGCKEVYRILDVSQNVAGVAASDHPEILIDPESGLFAMVKEPNAPSRTILASYHYLFSSDVGGSEGNTTRSDDDNRFGLEDQTDETIVVRIRRACASVGDNLIELIATERPRDPVFRSPSTPAPSGSVCSGTSKPWLVLNKPRVIVEIADSDRYTLDLCSLEIPAGYELTVRGAPKCFPTLELGDGECAEALAFELGAGAKLRLDRLRIANGGIALKSINPVEPVGASTALTPCAARAPNPCQSRVHDPVTRIDIERCTLLPIDAHAACHCVSIRPTDLIVDVPNAVVSIRNAILGKVRGTARVRMQIEDSIVDGQAAGCGCDAGQAVTLGSGLLRFERSTVLGKVVADAIDYAADSLFCGGVTVARQQVGGIRFSYVAPTCGASTIPYWKTPQQYFCQPAQAWDREKMTGKTLGWERMKPRFVSTHFLDPGYCQLAVPHVLDASGDAGGCKETCGCSCGPHKHATKDEQACHPALLQGAESGSEVGVFHDLYQPQRLAHLRQRIDAFTPFPMTTELRIEN